MTSSLPDRSTQEHLDAPEGASPVQYADVRPFYTSIAWPQVAVLFAIGAAVLGPIGLALLLAL